MKEHCYLSNWQFYTTFNLQKLLLYRNSLIIFIRQLAFLFFLTVPVDNLLMILFYSSGSRVFSVSPRARGVIAGTVAAVQEMSDAEV